MVVTGGVGISGAVNAGGILKAGTTVAGRGVTLYTSNLPDPVYDNATIGFNSEAASTHGYYDASIYVQNGNPATANKGQMFVAADKVSIGTPVSNPVSTYDNYATTATFFNGLATQSGQAPFKIQFGTTASGTGGTVTFADAFSATPTILQGWQKSSAVDSVYMTAVSSTAFTWAATSATIVHWLAIGPP